MSTQTSTALHAPPGTPWQGASDGGGKPGGIRPLAPALGAEVAGIDLTRGLDAADFATIRDALHRHSVIVLRDQHLSPPDQIELSKRLGSMRVSFYNQYAAPGFPELTVVSNIVEDGRSIGVMDAGVLWHTDASYLETPDMYTLLYALEVPERDGRILGNTLFVSTAAAYDALPLAEKERLATMKAVHSFRHHIDKKQATGKLKRAPLTEAQKSKLPDIEHPIVRTHPVTGRKCLFVTEGHTESVVGLTPADSDALLHDLWEHIKRPEFMYRHEWQVGDLLIWDNCATQHLAIQDYGDLRRRLYRSGIEGGRPV